MLNAQDIVKALGGRWKGNSGIAKCPAHDDKNPSLSVSEGEDGLTLWHCHAGCSQEDVRRALEERGHLETERPKSGTKKASSVIIAAYDYRGSTGDLLFQVVRYKPKQFRQRRPDGHDGWTWNLKSVERVPYRLPELLNSSDQPIFIAEGEKDVEKLRSLGLVATCNPGGAGKWRKGFAKHLGHRDVVILPDNDDAGRQHAEQVAKCLEPVAERVRILHLPDLPQKGDPHDWVEAGGTAMQLMALANKVPPAVPAPESNEVDWYADCIVGARGQPLSNHANVLRALRGDLAWNDIFGFDEMRQQVMLLRPAPVHGEPRASPLASSRPWTDVDDSKTQEWLQLAGLTSVSGDTVASAITQRAEEFRYHPVRDWLEGLEWDGIQRIEGCMSDEGEIIPPWLAAYLGSTNNIYTRAVGTMWLISAVARIFEPGCKADHILIHEGPQGSGKSTACRILCGDEHFSDGLPEIGTKDAKIHLAGKWIIELPELDALIRSEPSAVKAFLTQQIDKFRPTYGRREVDRPRQCIFIGTTNQSAYLKDETGARRYWPVRTNSIDLEALVADREQLWAEAVHLYRRGRPWHITDPEILAQAEQEQAARYDVDVWEEPVAIFLRGKESVTIGEVMKDALMIETSRMERRDQNRVMRIMTRLRWSRGKRQSKARLWVCPESQETTGIGQAD
jgi:predicted P-loop ATPase